jgi:glucokinase
VTGSKGDVMARGFPRLLGDIGGTNARWAWQERERGPLLHLASYASTDYPSVRAVIERYLSDHALPRPAQVGFGIATPITGDAVRMTNHPWSFSIAELKAALGVEHCVVINDFAALAAALPAFAPGDLRRIGGGVAEPATPLAVLGPGTGLGVAGWVPGRTNASGGIVVAGEGGHVTLAATNAREAAVIGQLQQRYGHASAERALSGSGLVNLYEALCALDGVAAATLQPNQVSSRALAGADPACVEALHLFAAFLGSVAGNLALTFGARGGVYLGGGIVPRLGPAFDALPFRARFDAKGRFRVYLERIPTWVITAAAPGLLGAASALDAAAADD